MTERRPFGNLSPQRIRRGGQDAQNELQGRRKRFLPVRGEEPVQLFGVVDDLNSLFGNSRGLEISLPEVGHEGALDIFLVVQVLQGL